MAIYEALLGYIACFDFQLFFHVRDAMNLYFPISFS